jgi:hypothetical protein
MNIDLTTAEWDQWRVICRLLQKAGAMTDADLNSPVRDRFTAGQRLLAEIRTWGDLRAKQGAQQALDE